MGEDFSVLTYPVMQMGGLVSDHVDICSGCGHVVWMKTGVFRYKDGPGLGGELEH